GVTVPPHEALSRPPRRARWCVPLWWRGYGLAVTDTVVVARHGLLGRRVALVPHAKVQSVRLVQGRRQRARGVADVHVDNGARRRAAAGLRAAEEAPLRLPARAERPRAGAGEARPDRWMA